MRILRSFQRITKAPVEVEPRLAEIVPEKNYTCAYLYRTFQPLRYCYTHRCIKETKIFKHRLIFVNKKCKEKSGTNRDYFAAAYVRASSHVLKLHC